MQIRYIALAATALWVSPASMARAACVPNQEVGVRAQELSDLLERNINVITEVYLPFIQSSAGSLAETCYLAGSYRTQFENIATPIQKLYYAKLRNQCPDKELYDVIGQIFNLNDRAAGFCGTTSNPDAVEVGNRDQLAQVIAEFLSLFKNVRQKIASDCPSCGEPRS